MSNVKKIMSNRCARLQNVTFLLALVQTVALQGQSVDFSKTHFLTTKTTITVVGENKLVVRQEDEIVVADEDSKDYGRGWVSETELTRLKGLHAAIYDSAGKELTRLRKKDIEESSLSSGSSYSEHRTKFYQLRHPELPYRLVRSREVEYKSTFFWPDWDPQENVPVDRAELQVILRRPVAFDYQNMAMEGPEISEGSGGEKWYTWRVDNVSKYESEYRSAPETRFQVGVKFRATRFDLGGFRGSSESWRSFGAWFQGLYAGQSMFSSEVAGLDGFSEQVPPRERIRNIYRNMQKQTRYKIDWRSIDGWRPHHADKVHKMKYGDCKDLSTYMIAMFARAGITAYPALVYTRDKGWVDPDFPSNTFNHCIAVVPMADDTLWLESTSDASTIDDPPARLEGINALIVKPDGGHLVRTPLSAAEDNQSVFTATAELAADRSLTVKGAIVLSGNQAIRTRSILTARSAKERQDWLVKQFSGRAADVVCNAVRFHHLDNPDSSLAIELDLALSFFARKAGSRLFFNPMLLHRIDFAGEPPVERKMALYNRTRFVNRDSVVFRLPVGFELKGSAMADSTVSSFGKFSFSATGKPSNRLIWKSAFVSRAREVPLEIYPEYYEFMTAVEKQSARKLVLKKHSGTF